MQVKDFNIDQALWSILVALHEAGARPLIVGGAVRDHFMGFQPKDMDIEVHQIQQNDLIEILSQFGHVDIVGARFGVIKVRTWDGQEMDFTMPRRENKTGRLHQDFHIEVDGFMSIREAARRRDFTMNSMVFDPFEQVLIDEFGGMDDIRNGIIRHTSDQFSEDVLRVFRCMQFAARFDMMVAPSTTLICRDLLSEFDTIVPRTMWLEFEKMFEKGIRPSRGIQFLMATGWIVKFPEILALKDVPQEAKWHPEGTALIHSMHVMDEAARISDEQDRKGEDRIVDVLAALCHDFGKATTTVMQNGEWRSPSHDVEGEAPTRSFCARIEVPQHIVERVVPLVRCHMRHVNFEGGRAAVRRLAMKVPIRDLAILVEADHSGRPPLPKGCPQQMLDIVEIAQTLNIENSKPVSIMTGKILINEMGFKQGREIGVILAQCMEAQMDEVFVDVEGGKAFVRDLFPKKFEQV